MKELTNETVAEIDRVIGENHEKISYLAHALMQGQSPLKVTIDGERPSLNEMAAAYGILLSFCAIQAGVNAGDTTPQDIMEEWAPLVAVSMQLGFGRAIASGGENAMTALINERNSMN